MREGSRGIEREKEHKEKDVIITLSCLMVHEVSDSIACCHFVGKVLGLKRFQQQFRTYYVTILYKYMLLYFFLSAVVVMQYWFLILIFIRAFRFQIFILLFYNCVLFLQHRTLRSLIAMGQMTMWNMKCVPRSDKPTEDYQTNLQFLSVLRFGVFQLIVLVLQSVTELHHPQR